MYENVRDIYLFLYSLMLFCFFTLGIKASKSKNDLQYWRVVIWIIIAYSLVEGLRWGRMVDWNLYCERYQEIGKSNSSDIFEPVFVIICYVFYNIGIPYWMFIVFQCGFLIFSCCLIIKRYKNISLYIFPLIPYLLLFNENFIRWFLALSFILISIHYQQENKRKYSILYFFISCFVHIGTIFFAPFLFYFRFFNRKLIDKRIAIILLGMSTMFASISQLHYLVYISDFLQSIGLGQIDPRLSFYLESAGRITEGEFGYVGISDTRTSTQIRWFLEYAPLLYFAPRYISKYQSGYVFYNFTLIGAIFDPMFNLVEILGRITIFFLLFTAITAGITYYNVFKRENNGIVFYLCLISFVCAVWPCISIMFQRTDFYDMTFIWDSHGRDFLPVIKPNL